MESEFSYRRSCCGPAKQALATAIFARTDVTGFERLEYELTSDAIELGLDAALPAVFELSCTIAEFGRGERYRADTIQLSVRIVGGIQFRLLDRASEIA